MKVFKEFLNKLPKTDLLESVKLGYNTIFENSFNGKDVVIVDIQPSYESYFSFETYNFVEFLNENYQDMGNILYLYNGEDF